MKNTKSRKKILLSSIAMLLVALVALGSATYAWFTINKTVQANTMRVMANVSDGLVITGKISHGNKTDWGREAVFNATAESLTPISFNVAEVGTSILTATTEGYYPRDVQTDADWNGTDANKGSWADHTLVSKTGYANGETMAMAFDDYSAAYTFWVASSGNEISGNVTAAISAATIEDNKDGSTFAKAALCDGSGNVIGFYNNGGYTAIEKTTTGGKTTYSLEASPAADSEVSNIAAISTTVPKWDGTGAGAAKEFTLYVWFEGQDSDCKNTAQGFGVNFTVDFTLAN